MPQDESSCQGDVVCSYIPRLKCLFRNEEHAKLMRWHSENRKKDGKLRAPADGSQWRKIERKYWDEFAKDPRNMQFTSVHNNEQWFLVNVYGPCQGELRDEFVSWIYNLDIYPDQM